MIHSNSSQFEEAKAADLSSAVIPFRWLREVDLACDRWLEGKGIRTFSYREITAFEVGARRAAKAGAK